MWRCRRSELHQTWYHYTMALNIKDPRTESLAGEVAMIAGESKTRAVRVALEERRDRLIGGGTAGDREASLMRVLQTEIWPQIPKSILGKPLGRAEREEILGYGPEGV
jgi:antitoxin VapB